MVNMGKSILVYIKLKHNIGLYWWWWVRPIIIQIDSDSFFIDLNGGNLFSQTVPRATFSTDNTLNGSANEYH